MTEASIQGSGSLGQEQFRPFQGIPLHATTSEQAEAAGRQYDKTESKQAEVDPSGDFAAVYEAHYQAVFRAVRGVVLDSDMAEDVTQDAFLKAYRARHRYRPTGSLQGWLCTIAVREALSRLRRATVQRRLLDLVRHSAQPSASPDGVVARVDELLSRLSSKTRVVVVLHYLHGYRYREIAEMLGLPEGTVASRLSHALLQMARIEDDR